MFSLVIPVYNEEKLIDELAGRTIPAVESFTIDYEIIIVDDGSTDQSLSKILAWRESNRKIKVLSLSKNFGHQAAYTAGLEYAKGDIVAMMDGDLQDPPELLAEMYRKITEEDFDIVSGKKIGRKGKKSRNLYAILFHGIFKHIGDIRNMDNYGNYSMMKRIAVDALVSMKEKVRYLPGLRSFIGFSHGDLDVIDIIPVPDRLKEGVGEAEGQDILDRLLAQVMIDAEDLTFIEDFGEVAVQGPGRVEVAAERLLHHDTVPVAVLIKLHPGQFPGYFFNHIGRQAQVKNVIGLFIPLFVLVIELPGQFFENLWLLKFGGHKAQVFSEAAPILRNQA